MACPICAWPQGSDDYPLLLETHHWRFVLAPNQSLLGRCVVQPRRHEGDLAHLTGEELGEWLVLVGTLERALRAAFGATMFNWSCYMNHSYREEPFEPHIHWWAVPRYAQETAFAGATFTDPTFGDPYPHGRYITVGDDVRAAIVTRLREALEASQLST